MDSSFSLLSTSVIPNPHKRDKVPIDWSELPPDLLHSIMLRISPEEIIENAQKVCTSWRRVSKEPLMWQKIDLTNPDWIDYDIDSICRQAVDRSESGLVEIMLTNFVHDSLLVYITDRSSKLRRLCLVLSNSLSCKGIVQAAAKLPLLEELEIDVSRARLDGLDVKAIGYSCPRLQRHILVLPVLCHDQGKMAFSSPMPCPHVMKDEEPRNWLELPPELMSSIMVRLDIFDILENAQMVCRAWRRITKEPSMWRKIDMRTNYLYGGNCRLRGDRYFVKMCRNAVDRSGGGLAEISIGKFGTDSLLDYIANRSPNLRSLALVINDGMTNNGLVNAVSKLPLLEELDVSRSGSKLELKPIGHYCPKLKKLNCPGATYNCYERKADDDDSLAIAESMPQLRHLELFGNTLTNTGLKAILDNCPHLEHLDLLMCSYIDLSGDLKKRCLEIKEFISPGDFTPFWIGGDTDSVEEDSEDGDNSADSDE